MEREKSMDPLEAKKLAAWKDSEDGQILEALNEQGANIFFHKEFPDLRDAFSQELKAVVCMDEGCAHKDYKGEDKLALAGAGILLPASSEEERIEIAARLFSELGIKDVTSHSGCGAVGLAYKRDFPDGNPTAKDLEDFGKKWTEKVVAEMGRMGKEANADHISAEEMERPAEFHNARVVYFDGKGGFNPNKKVGLPMGFVISRRHVPDMYAAEELKVAVSIAFGKHGFGNLFTKEDPFVIVPLANSAEELASLKNEIEQALQRNDNFEDRKIKIDGVVVE
jgi:hypothetical protein